MKKIGMMVAAASICFALSSPAMAGPGNGAKGAVFSGGKPGYVILAAERPKTNDYSTKKDMDRSKQPEYTGDVPGENEGATTTQESHETVGPTKSPEVPNRPWDSRQAPGTQGDSDMYGPKGAQGMNIHR